MFLSPLPHHPSSSVEPLVQNVRFRPEDPEIVSIRSSREASGTETNTRRGTMMARISRTASFVRRWTERHEERIQGRNELLQRLNLGRPLDLDMRSSCSTPPPPSLIQAYYEAEERRTRRREWLRAKKSKIFRRLRSLRLTPMSRILHGWLLVVTLTVLYNAFVIIARQTFTQLQDETWELVIWLLLDYTADALYITDIIIQCRTSKREGGRERERERERHIYDNHLRWV